MSDEAPLLAAVRTHPDEDTPRLVYADWLQEHGDADRAAFIRLQCEAARLPAGDKERGKKEKAAAALFRVHKVRWFGPLWGKFHTAKTAVGHCHIDRGFVVSLKGDVRQFVATADAIAAHAPCLRRVEVTHVEGDLGKLLAKPFIRGVAELSLDTMHHGSLAALKDHPDWGPFDALELGFEFNDPAENLKGLGDAPLVDAARRLALRYGYFLDEDADGSPAAQEPSLREMRRLKIPHLRGFGFHGMDADSAAAVTAWPPFKRLDWLDLGLCNMEDEAAVTLLSAKSLPPLVRLSLNENGFGTGTAEAVAASPKLTGLKTLTFDSNNLRDPDAKILADSTTLPAVLPMDVGYNHLTKAGVAKLRERFGPGVVSVKQFG